MLDLRAAGEQQLLGRGMVDKCERLGVLSGTWFLVRQAFGLLDVEQAVRAQEGELHHLDIALVIANDLAILVVRLLAHRFVQHREGGLLALAYMATSFACLVEGEPAILGETSQARLGPQQRNVDSGVGASGDGVDGERGVST
ncbi:hypothetical protein D3C76_815470 [compost metagenome]